MISIGLEYRSLNLGVNLFFVGFEKPTFDSRCKIFELDPCDSFGKVCLVYRESKTGK